MGVPVRRQPRLQYELSTYSEIPIVDMEPLSNGFSRVLESPNRCMESRLVPALRGNRQGTVFNRRDGREHYIYGFAYSRPMRPSGSEIRFRKQRGSTENASS
ncbi:uncharacterized protein MCYG_07513 [Microsporum canis CBS 113480]|uniref:Uncharacterized protein n=1 Tax=Arthroderma otae (strain ATCC MYA-4605 / CBS 113480) TaxID=554155 RepID=C5FYU6_ARTOC|nr:uncharacterized protein MCYG_07513 [Microsporum canis CBS 113480]EEQ34694.1 predicted protein [Microsporum canis CBS 113480]